jgi:hypothetical protein
MASAEIDFHGAHAIAMDGFKMVMENVLHLSRLFNAFCILGMARRAYHIAHAYAKHRVAFGHPIIDYPLVKENLARIKSENTALIAAIFATTHLQDDYDTGKVTGDEAKLLLRLLANLNKYLSALWSVEHIHHALDTLAGNGAIESFSPIPRLLRDSIVCENWEGTHNTLRMQILKDIGKFRIDEIFFRHINSLLSTMPTNEKRVTLLKQALGTLQEEVKSITQELASLQIKTVVDRMILLYAATHLLKEALDHSPSKLNCFDYFAYLHLEKGEKVYDQRHFNLIRAVSHE